MSKYELLTAVIYDFGQHLEPNIKNILKLEALAETNSVLY